MIEVLVPYSNVMRTYADRESPWDESDALDRDIAKWLDERVGDEGWDFFYDGLDVLFHIACPDVAMLFKLIWA